MPCSTVWYTAVSRLLFGDGVATIESRVGQLVHGLGICSEALNDVILQVLPLIVLIHQL
jgi:hypothetical protein